MHHCLSPHLEILENSLMLVLYLGNWSTNKACLKRLCTGVTVVMERGQQCLCGTRMQVGSLTRRSGLKDPAVLKLQCRSQLHLGSDSWLWELHILPSGQKRGLTKKALHTLHAASLLSGWGGGSLKCYFSSSSAGFFKFEAKLVVSG